MARVELVPFPFEPEQAPSSPTLRVTRRSCNSRRVCSQTPRTGTSTPTGSTEDLGLKDVVERLRRADIARGQAEVWMVQEIEELRPELEFLGFRHANILEGREVPIHVTRPFGDVAAFRAELLDRRVRVGRDALERVGIEPRIGSLWSAISGSGPEPGWDDSRRVR